MIIKVFHLNNFLLVLKDFGIFLNVPVEWEELNLGSTKNPHKHWLEKPHKMQNTPKKPKQNQQQQQQKDEKAKR